MKPHPREKLKAERIAKAKRFKALNKTLSLDEIGNMQTPKISRQRVGQLIASLK